MKEMAEQYNEQEQPVYEDHGEQQQAPQDYQKFDRPLTQREIAAQEEIEILQEELSRLDESFPACQRLLQLECYRIRGGVSEVIDVGPNKKTRVRTRLMLPVDQYPGFNVVGKLLGKGGSTLKKLQEETQTKLSILGAGSMRGDEKEHEALMSGDPKFQHLRLPKHLQIDCLATPEEAFYRISHAVAEAKKLMTPSPEEMANMYSQQQQQPMFSPMQGGGRGRGARGGAMGGRGSGPPRGRGAASVFGDGFSQNGGGQQQSFGGGYGQESGGGRFPRGRGGRGASRGSHPYGRGGQQ